MSKKIFWFATWPFRPSSVAAGRDFKRTIIVQCYNSSPLFIFGDHFWDLILFIFDLKLKSPPEISPFDDGHIKELPLTGADLIELIRPVLESGKAVRFRARGWSMAPLIRDGDIIQIAPLAQRAPGMGDVAAFANPGTGRLLVHRVIGIKLYGYLTQGDNLPGKPDGLIPAEAMLGKVVGVERNGQPVRFGLGVERWLIAFCSRYGLLPILARTFIKR